MALTEVPALPATSGPYARRATKGPVMTNDFDDDPLEDAQDADFVDDGIDDDEVDPEEQLLLDRKELDEAGLELDNPEGFADE